MIDPNKLEQLGAEARINENLLQEALAAYNKAKENLSNASQKLKASKREILAYVEKVTGIEKLWL